MLEQLTEGDFVTVAAWMSDPRDHEMVCGNKFDYPLSREQFLSYFIDDAGDKEKRLCFKYIEGNTAIGMASFTRIDRKNDYGHIGLVVVDPSSRGTGLGSSMLRELLQFGFDELAFNRIDLMVLESNTKAYSFYTNRIGFRNEGLIRDIIKVKGRYLSWYSLSILKTEWIESASGRVPAV